MHYNAVNAKVKGMKAHLLTERNYEELSKCTNVYELGLKLKEIPSYEKELKELEEKDLIRTKIEPKLIMSLMNEFFKIYKFIGDFNTKKYLDAFILEKEIHVIKSLLCAVYDKRDIIYTLPELSVLLGKNLAIDSEKLVASKNISEFIENLNGTRFYHLLDAAYENGATLFEMTTSLDIYYHIELWKSQNKYLRGDNLRAMKIINGCDIDSKNLIWLYRLKKFYNLDEAKMYSYIIPIYHNLSKSEIEKIVYAKTVQDMESEILNTKYGEPLLSKDNLENSYTGILGKTYKRTEIRYRNSITPIIAYMFYKNTEIRNVTSILEGVRYGLKFEEIQNHIYCK